MHRDTHGYAPIEAGRIDRTVAPAALAVSVSLAKQQCRVTHDHEDEFLEHLVNVATDKVLSMTRYACIAQTWQLTLDRFPGIDQITLPFAPLASVTSIKYDDEDGAEQTHAASNYSVETGLWPGRVRLKSTKEWPGLNSDINAVRVLYVVGHASAADVPNELKQAILMAVGHFYRNREDVITGTIASQLQNSMADLVAPFTVPRIWA
jgi:uncharacterized phiE125 gp8 family phage protein